MTFLGFRTTKTPSVRDDPLIKTFRGRLLLKPSWGRLVGVIPTSFQGESMSTKGKRVRSRLKNCRDDIFGFGITPGRSTQGQAPWWIRPEKRDSGMGSQQDLVRVDDVF